MSRKKKTKGQRLLDELNRIEAAETPEVVRVRRPLGRGKDPSYKLKRDAVVNVARGLHGQPKLPRRGRITADDLHRWYIDGLLRLQHARQLTAALLAEWNAELRTRAAALSDKELKRLNKLLDQTLRRKR